MAVKFGISSITLSSGDYIPFMENNITVVVGPNNSGKSSLLREINQIIQSGLNTTKRSRVVVANAEFSKEGDTDAHRVFLSDKTKSFPANDGQIYLRSLGVNVLEAQAHAWWSQFPQDGFHSSAPLYCFLADTLGRLIAANPPAPVNLLVDQLSHPIHVLQDDEDVEKRFSEYFKTAFGQDLILNRGAGSVLPLHIGKAPVVTNGNDRVSKHYLKELNVLPQVQNQGDGIRSFIGCLLSAVAMNRFVTLIDEPEAFLHPPQAKLLGGLLAKEHQERQLIVATHSGDVLRGLLDAGVEKLNVLRVNRRGDKNFANRLDPAEIKTLWADPILRFSNILDGLFHEGIVLCEADGDCRFFSTVLSSIIDSDKAIRWPDILFTSSGGKDRMPVIIRALAKINVPIRVAADFDLLADGAKAKEVFEALGGNWTAVDSDYKFLKNTVDKKAPPLSTNQVVEKIRNILSAVEKTELWSEDNKDEIRAAMKSTSSWAAAKESGTAAIPSGDTTLAVERILSEFKNVGLCLISSGELESFDRTVGNHGPKWVAKVLEKDLGSKEFEPARKYVRDLCKFNLS